MPRHTKPTEASPTPKDRLMLRGTHGTAIELSTPLLEKWFSQVELSLRSAIKQVPSKDMSVKPALLATQLISRFGRQTPLDVIVFLNSPAGKTIKALLNKKLAGIASLNEHYHGEQLLHQLQKKRRLAFFLLGLIYRRKARAHRLNEEIARDIENHVKPPKKVQTLTPSNATFAPMDMSSYFLYAMLLSYTSSTKAIQASLNHKLLEAEALEKALADIDEQIKVTESTYELFINFLDNIYQEVSMSSGSLMTLAERIHQKMQDISELIIGETSKISAFFDTGEDTNDGKLLPLIHALNLQQLLLKDMLSVIDKTKCLYTAEGELTTSFANAHFILSNQKKIVREGDKYFLLSDNQDLETLSSDEKEQSAQAFLRLKPDMMCVKPLVLHNQHIEQAQHYQTKAKLVARSEIMQKEILFLAKQLAQVEAAQSDTMLLLKQMKPSPSPQPSSNQECLSSSYNHMLLLMCKNPTPESIRWLKESQVHANNSPELQKQLNTLKPGKPLPPEMVSELQSRALAAKERPNSPTAPSPFSIMTPFRTNPL